MKIEFRWASETGRHGMPTVEECERAGYERVRHHPFFPESVLMRKGWPQYLDDKALAGPTTYNPIDV